ncbi:MAG TPA: chromosome segregation protein SMC [Acidimicrobiia bacterium]
MYLKSLKLVGFKSFADRTRMEFRPGVTVIVGPNGSGKSNIVDAIAWVMGTQSPKALRTSKMDDVIFAGTATRPGLGRSEVTLVLDNASGTLPLDLREVSITRRLYRDGSSDYEINGVGCRLLDIQEMLSDSGVGRHQHVIIGQGQIDSILNATPEDHRAVIEEAAGILKHRVRKDKAIRRLERTDADVLRLKDILGELTRQMRPLKRQAAAAARHDEVAGAASALRLFLGGEDLRRVQGRLAALATERAQLGEDVGAAEAEMSELESALVLLRQAAGEVGQALERDTAAAARLETTIERLRRIGSIAHERHRAGTARLEGADERRRDLRAEQDMLARQLESDRQAEHELRSRSEPAERRFRALESEERSLADQEMMTTEGAIAVVRGDLRSLDAGDERDTREVGAVDRRLDALRGQIDEEREEMRRINDDIREIDVLAGQAQRRYQQAESERVAAQDAWQRAEEEHTDARVGVAAAEARLEAVREAVEGLADREARGMAEAAAGALGSIAGRLDVPDEHAAAVDAALGWWSDAVAFGSGRELDDAVGLLKGAGRGGVPMVAGAGNPVEIARMVSASVGLKPLIDLLGPRADSALAARLLGDVLVAEGWKAARQIVAAHPEVRVVTPEGDLITVDGVRVAHPDGATPAMLEHAAIVLEKAGTHLARAESLLTQTRRVFDEARQFERDALETLEALEARLAGSTEAMARLDRGIHAAQQECGRLEERRASLIEASSERSEQRGTLVARLSALEGEEAERQRAWEDVVRRRQEVAERREAARAEWQEVSSQHRALAERVQLAESRLAAIAEGLASEEDRPVDPEGLARLAQIEQSARQAVDAARAAVDQLRTRQLSLRETAGTTGRRLGAAQDRHTALLERLAANKDRASEIAIESAELGVRRESIAETLRRDSDASEEQALSAERPEFEGDLREALSAKEAELRRMGPINPLAAAEYQEIGERHTFLTEQLDDLERSRRELAGVIAALDEEIKQRFLSAFEEIAAAYEKHFTVLFPGGRGRLRLTDPGDPLASGVDIGAQPLGKKVSKMSLLSGGERSLAALAFLFAVFRARPSPFYVLDEVEAALDDANLRRFLRLLDAFRDDAQLMIVTHQQQTMESADVLYGVTMEPGGSSKVVAKALHEVTVEV